MAPKHAPPWSSMACSIFKDTLKNYSYSLHHKDKSFPKTHSYKNRPKSPFGTCKGPLLSQGLDTPSSKRQVKGIPINQC